MTADSGPPNPAPDPPQAMQTPAEDLLIGQIAVEKGILRPEQLEAGLREQAASRTRGESDQLCQILIRQGSMTTDDLVRLVRQESQRAEGLPRLQRYDVQARLGEGATAVVYRAWDKDLRRPVALKILRESAGFSEIGRQRFRREAQAAAGLTHPNVITVHDAGEADGRLYLVMELVEGKPLSDFFRNPGVDIRERVRLLERACRGVAAAHEKGIVHRDLKPQNILIPPGGEPKVADFGLAHVVDSTTALTRTGTTLGTPLYMSPEQVEGKAKDVSLRTDVWALGSILYEALAGATPFVGETHMEIYGKISRHDPPPLPDSGISISRDLETVALKALEKDPAKRYPSAREFADDLRRILDGEAISARRVPPWVKAWRKLARRRAVVAVAAVLVAAAAWIAAVQWRHVNKVRTALAQAVEDEKAGRLQEARDGYRLVRELEPGNPPASEGFQRTHGELERRQRSLVEEARSREEAVKFMKPAVLQVIQGKVEIVSGAGREAAQAGQNLKVGQGLETIWPESSAKIRYMNVVEVDLDGETLVHQWLDESVSGSPRAVALNRGALRVTMPSAPPGKALIFSTSHLEVQAAPARFRLILGAASTRLVVEQGALRATRRSDGTSMLIEEGCFLDCSEKGSMSTQPLCAPRGRLVADFDSHVMQEWAASSQSANGSIIRRTTLPGLQGPGGLRLDYKVPDSEMVWVNQGFESSQDWSAFSGLSFWFNGSGTKTSISFELWENKEPRSQAPPERFWFMFKDDFVGWKKFDVPWREFKRRPFPGTPDDGFTQKEMWGLCFIFHGWGGARQGSCEIDQIELLPPASAEPQKPWVPIFDGKNLDGFDPQTNRIWRVSNGALICDPNTKAREAMRTSKDLGDAEVRIRFDVLEDMDRIYFAIRQVENGRYMVAWTTEQIRELKGRPRELIFVCRGEDVSATLDGNRVPIEPLGRPREGRLQFSGNSPGLRIFSIDYRELR